MRDTLRDYQQRNIFTIKIIIVSKGAIYHYLCCFGLKVCKAGGTVPKGVLDFTDTVANTSFVNTRAHILVQGTFFFLTAYPHIRFRLCYEKYTYIHICI